MSKHQTLVQELDDALANCAIGHRADALRQITDHFLSAPSAFTEREIAVFDDVMMRLAEDMETALRAALASRLAKIPNAPRNLIRALAADTAIEVAAPVLTWSPRLDEPTLVEHARTGSQDHLLAISKRALLGEAITDVLIERGDRIVALSTVNNAGARFSETGHRILVDRSKDDDDLAMGIWSRPDIPHRQLLRLFSLASDNVRRRLEAADRGKAQFIRDMVVDVSNQIQSDMRAQSRVYLDAERTVALLHRHGELNDARLLAFATAGKFEEATVGLSILCDLPIGATERAMVQDRPELILLLAKAIGLSWPTTKAILILRAGPGGMAPAEIEQGLSTFSRLRPETARKALHFIRLRERASIFSPSSAAFN